MNIGVKHIVIIVASLFLAGAGYWYIEYRSLQGVDQLDPSQVQKLIKEVSEYTIVPEGVDPSQVQVAAVQDAEALKKASVFFQDAQNGDQLLMFPNRLILFRPSERKVVNISASAGIQTSTTTAASAVATNTSTPSSEVINTPITEPITVEIRNGSGITGLASRYRTSITESLKRVTVTRTGNAANENYTTTIIVNLKNKNIADIENRFSDKNTVSVLPEGEASSAVDVVIILGKSAQ